MSERNKIEQKIVEIDQILRQIEEGDVELSDIAEKYKLAIEKAKELELELDSIQNEIEILSKDFSQNA